jgi:hypothetical protein
VNHGSRIDAAVLGDGKVGVVFANDSGNSACGWMSFARQLVGRGMRVLAFEYEVQSEGYALLQGTWYAATQNKFASFKCPY